MTNQSDQAESLCSRIRENLPIQAWLKPALLAKLQEIEPSIHIPAACLVVKVIFYAEFGISCGFVFSEQRRTVTSQEQYNVIDLMPIVPITSLDFDVKTPLGREIAAYQKILR